MIVVWQSHEDDFDARGENMRGKEHVMKIKKCFRCGKEITFDEYSQDVIYCVECAAIDKAEREELSEKKRKVCIEIMLKKAINIISGDRRRANDMCFYKKSFDVVAESARETPNIFDSTEEMVSAICMHADKRHFRVQQKVGSRRVDICLPDEKILIEIDGSRHSGREFQDTVRDIEILQKIGFLWEIVHIEASYVNKNPTQVYRRAIELATQKREHKKLHGYDIAPEVAKAVATKNVGRSGYHRF